MVTYFIAREGRWELSLVTGIAFYVCNPLTRHFTRANGEPQPYFFFFGSPSHEYCQATATLL